jgi:hypothetical protein
MRGRGQRGGAEVVAKLPGDAWSGAGVGTSLGGAATAAGGGAATAAERTEEEEKVGGGGGGSLVTNLQ